MGKLSIINVSGFHFLAIYMFLFDFYSPLRQATLNS
jgi:hypothetical protein